MKTRDDFAKLILFNHNDKNDFRKAVIGNLLILKEEIRRYIPSLLKSEEKANNFGIYNDILFMFFDYAELDNVLSEEDHIYIGKLLDQFYDLVDTVALKKHHLETLKTKLEDIIDKYGTPRVASVINNYAIQRIRIVNGIVDLDMVLGTEDDNTNSNLLANILTKQEIRLLQKISDVDNWISTQSLTEILFNDIGIAVDNYVEDNSVDSVKAAVNSHVIFYDNELHGKFKLMIKDFELLTTSEISLSDIENKIRDSIKQTDKVNEFTDIPF